MFAKRAPKRQDRRGPISQEAETEAAGGETSSRTEVTGSKAGGDGREGSVENLVKAVKKQRMTTPGKHFIQAVSERRKHTAEETLHGFKSDRKLTLHNDNRATAVFDADTDKAHDHRAILERNAEIGEKIEKGELEAGIYRGQGAHRVYVKRREGALSHAKTTGLYGPVRGTNNVRMTMYVDYNPEICKDYKETGYCGFGNTCKFLHDRTDYKGGWQIEREWQQLQKRKQASAQLCSVSFRSQLPEKLRRIAEGLASSDDDTDKNSESSDASEDEEGLPFACLKCRQKWTEEMNPVVTRCGHYFCETCAYSHYSTSIKCYQCGKETQGIFNAAFDLLKKVKNIEADRARKAQRRKQRRGDHAEASDDDAQSEDDGKTSQSDTEGADDGRSDGSSEKAENESSSDGEGGQAEGAESRNSDGSEDEQGGDPDDNK
ncbi:zinc finger (CCCH type) motif-containing protein [Besnoitia besnoiti]|uniref:Zinc finger (CCCH type) motif-containing protein n=1 Tax=Besnoitia besnoiti TaxID=94643 RepID=A0A2A9M9G7_BESBE|nr:zinc finger (CCCH type) motif-containing protein [Besnoitia besnoiti]PFH35118.1 zinc finger (CCCH type) motif-containing protein [Besnoitia besnoiti]